MNLHTTDRFLLKQAIKKLHQQTGLELYIQAEEVKMGDITIDAVVEVKGYETLRFAAEIKKWAQQANLGAMMEQVRQLPGKGMLVADYVNPNMADKMREMDIPFIDAAGNAYLNEKPLHVFIKGNKQEKVAGVEQRGRAFKPTGIKVIHALLTKPELVNAPYREIKDVAGVAIGTIGWILYDLKETGFMVEQHNGQRRLENKKKLVDRWVEAYLEKLRPKQLVGKFTTDIKYWWQDVNLAKYEAKWGGEVAAAKITDYLRPEKLIIYLPKKGGEELFKDERFRKDEFGEIAVYRAFWNEDNGNGLYEDYQHDLADPLVVYADLLATLDTRNIEIAKIIYGKEIARLID